MPTRCIGDTRAGREQSEGATDQRFDGEHSVRRRAHVPRAEIVRIRAGEVTGTQQRLITLMRVRVLECARIWQLEEGFVSCLPAPASWSRLREVRFRFAGLGLLEDPRDRPRQNGADGKVCSDCGDEDNTTVERKSHPGSTILKGSSVKMFCCRVRIVASAKPMQVPIRIALMITDNDS